MFRPYMWAIFRLWLDFRISYTGMCGESLGSLRGEVGRPPLPHDSPRTLHAFLCNWSRSLIATWRWPTYRAETCRCYNILLVIIQANIVVLECKYWYTKLLTIAQTQRGWRTSEHYAQLCAATWVHDVCGNGNGVLSVVTFWYRLIVSLTNRTYEGGTIEFTFLYVRTHITVHFGPFWGSK